MNLTMDLLTPLQPDGLDAAWTLALRLLPWLLVAAIALGAAWFGARMALGVGERQRLRVELTRELRDTHAAIAWAHSVLSGAASLKRRHIAGIRQEFESNRTRLEDQLRRRATGEVQGNSWPHFDISLRSLVPPVFGTEMLRDLVLHRISAPGRPLMLAIRIHEVAATLVAAIATRNEQIDGLLKAGGLEGVGQAQRYFGLPFGDGHVDSTYRGTLEMMASCADDAIHFAYLLCVDLDQHASTLRARYRRRLGHRDAPQGFSIDFAVPLADGTIPGPDAKRDLGLGQVRTDE